MKQIIALPVLLGIAVFWSCRDPRTPGLDAIKQEIRTRFPEVKGISVEEFAEWNREQHPLLVVDVREPAEFEVSHLENAVHSQNPGEIRRRFQEGNYSALVVYCSVGYRSAQMASRLKSLGIEPVFNLEGSIFEWANQGRPLFDNRGPTGTVHPYDATWGAMLRPSLRAPIP